MHPPDVHDPGRDLRWTLTLRRHGQRELKTVRGAPAWLLLIAALGPWVVGLVTITRWLTQRLHHAAHR